MRKNKLVRYDIHDKGIQDLTAKQLEVLNYLKDRGWDFECKKYAEVLGIWQPTIYYVIKALLDKWYISLKGESVEVERTSSPVKEVVRKITKEEVSDNVVQVPEWLSQPFSEILYCSSIQP